MEKSCIYETTYQKRGIGRLLVNVHQSFAPMPALKGFNENHLEENELNAPYDTPSLENSPVESSPMATNIGIASGNYDLEASLGDFQMPEMVWV